MRRIVSFLFAWLLALMVRADVATIISQDFTGFNVAVAGTAPAQLGTTDWWRCYGNPKEYSSETGDASANYSMRFQKGSAKPAFGRTIVSPPISGNIGAVKFRIFAKNPKDPVDDGTGTVFLTTETNYITFNGWDNAAGLFPNSVREFTIPTSNLGQWMEYTVYLNMQIPAETPQRVGLGFMETSVATFDLYVDDIQVFEMPSSMVEKSPLSTTEGLPYAVSGIEGVYSSVHPEISFLTVGNVSNCDVKLYHRFSGETEWNERAMVQNGDVWHVQADTIDVGRTSGVQLELYAVATYENEEGPQTAELTYTAESPLRLDIVPRGIHKDHHHLVVSGAFETEMAMTTNGVWVAGYERSHGVNGDSFAFVFLDDEGPIATYGNAGVEVPFNQPVSDNTWTPAPASIDRDIVFRVSEGNGTRGVVFYADYQSFEAWDSSTNNIWSVEKGADHDSGVVTDEAVAQEGASALLLRAGDSLVLDKSDAVGVSEVGFWMRRAGAASASVSVKRHREGQESRNRDVLTTVTGLPTDRYAYYNVAGGFAPMETDTIILEANTDVYVDAVFAADCSVVRLLSMNVEPLPIRQNMPITMTATFQLLGGGKVDPEKILFVYGQGTSSDCVSKEVTPVSEDGMTWLFTLQEGVPESDQDFYFGVKSQAKDYQGHFVDNVNSTTNCFQVIPYSEVESVTLENGIVSHDMRLASDRLWKGAFPKSGNEAMDSNFWFLDSDNVKRGAADATQVPSSGALVVDEEFALTGVSTDLAFEYNEADQTYRIQQAFYAPMTDLASLPGWTQNGAEASSQFGGSLRFDAGDSFTTPARSGVGQIMFWAARVEGAPLATYKVEVSKAATGTDWTQVPVANGGMGTIAGENMRFYRALIGDPEVQRVRVTFQGSVYVQESVVTASGSFVTMSSPVISLDDGASFSPSDAVHTKLPYGGRPYLAVNLDPMNGAYNVNVTVEAVMADLVNGVPVPVEGADIVPVPMTNDVPGEDGGTFRVWMPALTAGVTAYRFVADYEGEDATLTTFPKNVGSWFFYETDDALSAERETDFSKVLHNNTSYFRPIDGWQCNGMYLWSAQNQSVGFFPTAGSSTMQSSRAYKGIGRVYFKAYTPGKYGNYDLDFQVSTNGSQWETLNTITIPFGEGVLMEPYTQFCIELNDYSAKYIRFIRPQDGGPDSDNIYLMDLVVTPPAANMAAVMPSIIHPGYPSKKDDITFAVDVSNVYAEYPAVNARVDLRWRRAFGSVAQPWQSTPMTSTDGNHFTVTLPAMNPGKFEYYAQVSFQGASYRYTYTKDMPLRFMYAGDADYFDVDPRGGNESCTPAYLFSDTQSPAEFTHTTQQRALEAPTEYENLYLWFRVRAFESQHDHLQVVYTNALEVVEEEQTPTVYTNALQLIGDNLWLTTTAITNDIHYFLSIEGVSPYGGAGTTEYLAEPTLWGDDNQETVNPPLASVAGTEESNLIEINLGTSKPITMMVRFDAASGSYQVRRAAYQDFNDWGADTTYFEDSLGLYNIQNYEQPFDGSSQFTETSMDYRLTTFDQDTIGDYSSTYYYTTLGWRLNAGEILRERTPHTSGDRVGNVAARIGSRGGYFQNEVGPGSNGNGLESVSLRTRVSYGADGYTPYDRTGFGLDNYEIAVSNIQVSAMSDGNPYVQVMVAFQDPENYVAYRLTQTTTITETGLTYPHVKQEIINRVDGEESVLASMFTAKKEYKDATLVTSEDSDKIMIGSLNEADIVVELGVTNGMVTGRALLSTMSEGSAALNSSITTFLSAPAPTEGTISFDTFDAQANFRSIYITENGSSRLVDTSNWYLGGRQAGNSAKTRWVLEVPQGKTGTQQGLARKIPDLRYTIGVAKAGESASLPGRTPFETGASFVADTLTYSTATRSIHYWGNAFVRIKPELSDADLVIDDVVVRDWRGRNLPEEAPNDDQYWQAREAVVVTHNGSRMLALNTSRANPAARQMISTPEMLDGIGTLSFNYLVDGGAVTFVVEHNAVGGAYGDNASYIVDRKIRVLNGEKGEVYQAIRLTQTGKVRVRVLSEESDEDATLYLDNFFAKGFPEDDGRSWSAYNALIVAPTRNATVDEKQFDEDITTQTAFLNNSIDSDTRQNLLYNEHMPFIQSPVIDTGIGEVGFWYRAWNPLNVNPGKITFWVSEDPGAPDNLWRQVTEADLAIPEKDPGMSDADFHATEAYISYTNQVASFRALSNITNGDYQYFSAEFCNDTNFVLRICCDTNDAQRVAIDNIIVTEPVRASIEVLSVSMYPNAIPLGNEPVGFMVQLGNPRMNPTDIHVYADYFMGTNVWGVNNWGYQPDASIELVQDAEDPFLYKSAEGDMIPGLPVDSVVQYRIRVTYTGTFASPVSSVAFENPKWYEPIDLNETYKDDGFSPYYFVFSCPTGCVYISEFYPAAGTANYASEFIEIVGPAGASMAGWTLDIINGDDASQFTDSVKESYTLPAGSTFKAIPEKTHGWGVFVVGDNGESIADHVDVQFTNPETQNMPTPGGIRLCRSMGAYVDRVSWGTASSVAANAMKERGYTYAGNRSTSSSYATRIYSLDAPEGELKWELAGRGVITIGQINSGEMEDYFGQCPYIFTEEFKDSTAQAFTEYFDKYAAAAYYCELVLNDATSLDRLLIDETELTLGSGFDLEDLGEGFLSITLKPEALSALNLSTETTHTITFDVNEGEDPVLQLVVIDTTPEEGDKSTDVSITLKGIQVVDGKVIITATVTNNEPEKTVEGWSWGVKSAAELGDEFVLVGDLQPLTDADLEGDLTKEIEIEDTAASGFYKGVLNDGE